MRFKPLSMLMMVALTGLLMASAVRAQNSATAEPRTKARTASSSDSKPTPGQVVTIVHRINGLKMLRLLIRSGEPVGAVNNLTQFWSTAAPMHTNIIAGLALGDGETIVAWVPEANVEFETRMVTSFSDSQNATSNAFVVNAPDLTVFKRNGMSLRAEYIGVDETTGLALLKLIDKAPSSGSGIAPATVTVRQRVHLFSPEQVAGTSGSGNAVYFKTGETPAEVDSIALKPGGVVSRIRVKSARLSTANIGAVALDDAGQTIGIVNSIEGDKATLLPPETLREAAARVLAHHGSVPRPWLGVQGEAIAATPLTQLVATGWARDPARALLHKRRGILLTSVTPSSPAAVAAIRPGDVIVSVNGGDVKTPNDLSLLLEDAVDNNPVQLTLLRPGRDDSESLTVTLRAGYEARAGWDANRATTVRFRPNAAGTPFIGRGIEAIPLAQSSIATESGFLVLFVQPETPLFKSGLKPGDVIESINGEKLTPFTTTQQLQDLTAGDFTLVALRGKQKLVLNVSRP